MVRLFALLAVAFTLSAPVQAETLAPPAYTREVAQALAKALPQRQVTVAGELELSIRNADGGKTSLSLRNQYSGYAHDPALFDTIVQRYVETLSQPAPQPGSKPDRSRIVPVIKDRQWIDDNYRAFKSERTSFEFVYEDFNRELIIVYAEDSANRMRYLTTTEDIGVDRKELRKLAVDNLKRLLPKIEMRQHDDVFAMFTAGGDYEASLLLLDSIWTGGQVKMDGDIVVAVPAKDVLLVTGSRNRKGLEVVRKMTAHFVTQDRYRISDKLFVYRDGRFKKFGRD